MLEFLTGEKSHANSKDVIVLIKNDHDKVKQLFKEFEETDNLRTKKKIAAAAIMELKMHAEVEEKIFYPAVREEIEEDLMNEADEEHHVAKLLIAELDQMDGSETHWEAKFTVLAENIRHHIKEEEGEMLPKARKLDIDYDVIGQKFLAMKADMKKNGVPPCAEELLMKHNRPADSSAKNAKKTVSAPSKKAASAPARKATGVKKASPKIREKTIATPKKSRTASSRRRTS